MRAYCPAAPSATRLHSVCRAGRVQASGDSPRRICLFDYGGYPGQAGLSLVNGQGGRAGNNNKGMS